MCLFHLLISFPWGSIIHCSRGEGGEAETEDRTIQLRRKSASIRNLSLIQVRYSFESVFLLVAVELTSYGCKIMPERFICSLIKSFDMKSDEYSNSIWMCVMCDTMILQPSNAISLIRSVVQHHWHVIRFSAHLPWMLMLGLIVQEGWNCVSHTKCLFNSLQDSPQYRVTVSWTAINV